MKSYVVRIYQNLETGKRQPVGTVEDVAGGRTLGFRGLRQLGRLLLGAQASIKDKSASPANRRRNLRTRRHSRHPAGRGRT